MMDRLILVGFMCAGKSTVGPLVADRLDWEFFDFDEIIEREQGKSIAAIFAEHGESHFRHLERELTERVRDRTRVVVAPGGGWITQPGLLERLRPGSLIVWLRVAPGTVLERQTRDAGKRPLLAGTEPEVRIQALLRAREPYYRLADCALDTDRRSPAELADEVAGLLVGEMRRC